MSERLKGWLTNDDTPVSYRSRLAELLRLRACAPSDGRDLIEAEIVIVVNDLGEYMDAFAAWQDEGGR